MQGSAHGREHDGCEVKQLSRWLAIGCSIDEECCLRVEKAIDVLL